MWKVLVNICERGSLCVKTDDDRCYLHEAAGAARDLILSFSRTNIYRLWTVWREHACEFSVSNTHTTTHTYWDTLTSSPPALPAACWSSAGCHQCRLCSVVESMKQWEDDREREREGRTLICFCSRGEMPRLSCDLDIWLNLYGFKIRSSPMLHSQHVLRYFILLLRS